MRTKQMRHATELLEPGNCKQENCKWEMHVSPLVQRNIA